MRLATSSVVFQGQVNAHRLAPTLAGKKDTRRRYCVDAERFFAHRVCLSD